MARMNLYYSELSAGCNQYLADVLNKLNSVINDFNNLYIPYDCSRKHQIENLKDKLKNKRDKVEDVRTWIRESNKDFSSACTECENRIARLPNVKFGVRK